MTEKQSMKLHLAAIAVTLTMGVACGGADGGRERTAAGADGGGREGTAAGASLPSKTIAVRVLSGKEQPPPERWNAQRGQRVVLDIQGMGPPSVRVVGPGLPASGLTNGAPAPSPRLSFTPREAGDFHVELIEAPVSLGTLHVE
jgi:hypothetical protein